MRQTAFILDSCAVRVRDFGDLLLFFLLHIRVFFFVVVFIFFCSCLLSLSLSPHSLRVCCCYLRLSRLLRASFPPSVCFVPFPFVQTFAFSNSYKRRKCMKKVQNNTSLREKKRHKVDDEDERFWCCWCFFLCSQFFRRACLCELVWDELMSSHKSVSLSTLLGTDEQRTALWKIDLRLAEPIRLTVPEKSETNWMYDNIARPEKADYYLV